MEKTVTDRSFDPERYGMIYCPLCNGSGSLFNGFDGRVVCEICGGFGCIKKEDVSLGFRPPWSLGVEEEV
jgi:hypothetical protein